MSMAITFDTLKFANRLKAAGMDARQAEALAEAQAEALEVNLKELATGENLKHLEDRIDARLANTEERLDSRLMQLEQRMTIRLGAMLTVAVAVVATLVKLL